MKFFKTKNCSIDLKSEGDNCCSTQPKGKIECPSCGKMAKGVLGKTLNCILKEEIKLNIECLDGFHYCKSPSCPIVYFRDDITLTQKDLSVVVGLKDGATPSIVCYCFDWTKEKIRDEIMAKNKTVALEDIKEKMNSIGCRCEVLNPSGGCCLGDVGNMIKEVKKELSTTQKNHIDTI